MDPVSVALPQYLRRIFIATLVLQLLSFARSVDKSQQFWPTFTSKHILNTYTYTVQLTSARPFIFAEPSIFPRIVKVSDVSVLTKERREKRKNCNEYQSTRSSLGKRSYSSIRLIDFKS